MKRFYFMPNKKDTYYKELSVLVLPIAFQNLMTAAVNTADIVMSGMVSQTALSAVSLASQIQFVLNLFYMGLTIGTTTLAAQYWGKGDVSAVEQILGTALRFSIIISAVFSLAAIFLPDKLMLLFTSDETLVQTGIPYLKIAGVSYLFMSVSQIYLCIMKNTGKTLKSTLISSGAMLLNIFLNAVFILGLFGMPRMEAAGAAFATAIARCIELIWCLIEASRNDSCKIRGQYLLKTNPVLMRDFIYYTSPVMGNELVWGCGFTMYSVLMGHLGSDAVAANSIANVVKNLAASLCLGVGSGGGILVGHILGRHEIEKAKNYASRLCKTALLSGVIGGAAIFIARPFILSFVKLTDSSYDYLSTMLFICCFYMIGKALASAVIAGIFCAGGDTRFGLMCDIIDMWLFAVPLGFFAAFVLHLPVTAVYFIISLDEIAKLPFVYIHYKKYRWLKNLTHTLERV